jgi:uncharacterized protein (DUF427 family)
MPKPIKPKAGQESVWDYPRPPRLEPVRKTLRIEFAGQVIAETNRGYRVLETSHPPVYYVPPEDVRTEYLRPHAGRRTFCEWKGQAEYWDLHLGDKKSLMAAWSYPEPSASFQPIQDYLAFYPSKVDACYVDGERVQAQEGDFYGGWITSNIVGPFKGGAGTWGW